MESPGSPKTIKNRKKVPFVPLRTPWERASRCDREKSGSRVLSKTCPCACSTVNTMVLTHYIKCLRACFWINFGSILGALGPYWRLKKHKGCEKGTLPKNIEK